MVRNSNAMLINVGLESREFEINVGEMEEDTYIGTWYTYGLGSKSGAKKGPHVHTQRLRASASRPLTVTAVGLVGVGVM